MQEIVVTKTFGKSLYDNRDAGFVKISNFECSCRLLDSRFTVILSLRDSETQFDSLVTQKGSSCSFISIYLVKDKTIMNSTTKDFIYRVKSEKTR